MKLLNNLIVPAFCGLLPFLIAITKKSSQRNTPAVVYPFMNSRSLSFMLYSVF